MSQRSSGILLHPTSLPSPFGIGGFGAEARAFIDFLADARQSLWQTLPLGPTGYGNSPYQGLSAFAGNMLLIDPRTLVDEGLLETDDIAAPVFLSARVDFDAARTFKAKILNQAFQNFRERTLPSVDTDFEEFCACSSWWLEDYALFSALKTTQGDREWSAWDRELRFREPRALQNARNQLADEIEAQKFFQCLFFRQYSSLRHYARERNVKIIGDLPIFVAHDSADVWAHARYFKLDENGAPVVVAGVPPDYFSETGQLWGNPLYDWERLRADNFQWWIDRVRWLLELFDLIRVDHFRGFAACWQIPAGEVTARRGVWVKTPGRELFTALKKTLGDLPIIAENLGVITPDVESLRAEFGFPGMRVLQFAFGSDATNDHLPHNYEQDTVAYTGTHDNDTTIGWFEGLRAEEREFCCSYLASDGREINWDMIRAAMASVSGRAIIPMQDLLGLGREARMNLPASENGNWAWRMEDMVRDDLSTRLRKLTQLYGRTAGTE
ncbi:MAG: 4-alpha-glucanotransferase [Pyrinomonadaceae bacterium]